MVEKDMSKEMMRNKAKSASKHEHRAELCLLGWRNPDHFFPDQRPSDLREAIHCYEQAYVDWKDVGNKRAAKKCLKMANELEREYEDKYRKGLHGGGGIRERGHYNDERINRFIEEGKLPQAISLLKGKGYYQDAAELYEKMGKHQEASMAYRMAAKWYERNIDKPHEEGDVEYVTRFKRYTAELYEKAGDPASLEKARKLRKEIKEKSGGLEKTTTAAIGIVGILAGIFFLSSNITGNAIGNMTNSISNILGAILLAIGLIGGFFWIKNRRK